LPRSLARVGSFWSTCIAPCLLGKTESRAAH
jgi:hypothetical protein